MKILVVCQHYRPEPFNVSEICEELSRRGHSMTVLTGLPNYPEGIIEAEYRKGRHRDEILDGVRVVRVPVIARGKSLHGLGKLKRVANYLSFPASCSLALSRLGSDFDCVVAFQFSPILMAVPGLKLAKKTGVPCLLYSFDLWPEDMLTGGMSRSGLPYAIMKRVSRGVYESADVVAVTSPGFRNYYSDELGLDDIAAHWLPQYAEAMFENMPRTPRSCEGDRVVFAFAGNVGGNQSVETIVRAASILGDDPRIAVRVVGSGSRLDDCKALAASLDARNVEFVGRLPLEEMPRVYAGSDAMLLNLARANGGSLVPKYTIPRKLQSYLASGKPVIASAEGDASRIVERTGCGLSCPPEDPEALAAAMLRFADMPAGDRADMGIRARQVYDEQFSRERFFRQLELILDEMERTKRG